MTQQTIKVQIDWDEWYPVFTVTAKMEYPRLPVHEIPIELYERWKKAENEFLGTQQEMRAMRDSAKAKT